jgi:hypothetical protein
MAVPRYCKEERSGAGVVTRTASAPERLRYSIVSPPFLPSALANCERKYS